jgi:hypothetical protein
VAYGDPSHPWASDQGGAPPLWARQRAFVDLVAGLKSFSKWLEWGQDRLPEGELGDKTKSAHVLTREIDALLRRHTRYKLTVGLKHPDPGQELLAACLEILKLEVNSDSMVRRLVVERNKVPAQNS